MGTLSQIGAISGLGSLLLSQPATLQKGAATYPVNAMLRKGQKPYRANENRKPFDVEIRVDRGTSAVEPQQNDVISIEGDWIVWRIRPSAAGSHWALECMAQPTVGILPVQETEVPDTIGGKKTTWTALTDALFYGKVREATVTSRLTAETKESVSRLMLSYKAADVPTGFGDRWRVMLDGVHYAILSVSTDDENPAWRNAVLTRELSA